jgi:hypothetical protein
MLELIIIRGPANEGKVYSIALGQSFTIGRSSDCSIVLPSSGVSKQHCSITPLNSLRIEIEDLGSANGTFVNGLLIKKHVIKPGDSITVHQFTLQLRKQAPQLVVASPPREAAQPVYQMPSGGFSASGMATIGSVTDSSEDANASRQDGNVIYNWFENNIFPIADRLSARTSLIPLIFGSVLIWSVLVSIFSVNPFKNRANFRIQDQSIEVARLYARQIARLNLDAIIEQRYSGLVTQLDSKRGQTPGIVEAMIIDRVNAQILAPPEKLGQALPSDSPAAAIAVSKDVEYVGVDENSNTAFVVVPIVVGTPEGNKAVASAYVRFNYLENQFSFASVLDQMLNSILISLTFGWVLFAFLYRWTEGSLQRSADAIQQALKSGDTSISFPVKSRGAENLAQEIGYALAKTGGSSSQPSGMDAGTQSSEWAISAVNNTGGAAAALDGKLTILAWNPRMAQILNIQESVAVGAEISQASRDVAFESTVRDLAQEAVLLPWRNASRQIEMSGRPQMISVVFGGSAFLVNVDSLGDK